MPHSTLATAPVAEVDDCYRKITWRLMPLLFVCYIFAHLDRINIGFAKLQMTQDPVSYTHLTLPTTPYV